MKGSYPFLTVAGREARVAKRNAHCEVAIFRNEIEDCLHCAWVVPYSLFVERLQAFARWEPSRYANRGWQGAVSETDWREQRTFAPIPVTVAGQQATLAEFSQDSSAWGMLRAVSTNQVDSTNAATRQIEASGKSTCAQNPQGAISAARTH
jgi:hypothetical protein